MPRREIISRVAGTPQPSPTLRPLCAADAEELRRIRREPDVRRWWGAVEPNFPLDGGSTTTRWVIEMDGAVAGLVQFSEENGPRYRHASIDIFLDPTWHNRGVGSLVIRRTVDYLVSERGHHRVTIDPAAENAAAIRAYEKVGFRPVGILRRYERDDETGEWRDGLLMEFLAAD